MVLVCQECRGTGRVTEQYYLGYALRRPCLYCGGSGEVTPAIRGAWLRDQRRVKRQRDALRMEADLTALETPTEPSKEALAEARRMAGLSIVEWAHALDRFRAAGVREERERCFQWAIDRIPRSAAARSIRDGDPAGEVHTAEPG